MLRWLLAVHLLGFAIGLGGMLASILLLEILPMITFIKWRTRLAKNETIDATNAASFATTSFIQAALILGMMLAATAMARGYGVSN